MSFRFLGWAHLWSPHLLIGLTWPRSLGSVTVTTLRRTMKPRKGQKQAQANQEMMDVFAELIFPEEK